MTKIKLYCKPKKIEKLKLVILPFMFSLSTVIGGCGAKGNNLEKTHRIEGKFEVGKVLDDQSSVSIPSYSYDSEPIEGLFQNGELPVNLNLLETKIELNSNEIVELTELISQETYYKDSEYFEIEVAFEKYNNRECKNITSNNIIVNGKIDGFKLYESVLKNNKKFLEIGVNKDIYIEYSNEKIKYICDIITETINKELSEVNKDLNILDYNLSNLKIFEFTKPLYGLVSDEGCLLLNEKYINTLNKKDAFEKILTHETMHILQLNDTYNNHGISYKFDGLNVNSLFSKWFLESTAEKNASNYTGEEILYQNDMRYLNSFMVVTSLSKDKIEDANFGDDLDKFYQLLNCDGLIKNTEIANMMFAINFSLNESDELNSYYYKKTGNYLSGAYKREMKNLYSSTAFETLAKKLYYELSKNSLSLKDIFSMISLFENCCSDTIWYGDSYKLEENKKFIENYNNLQQCYFNILAKKLNITKEEIYDLYNYYNENQDVNINCTNRNEELNELYLKIKHNKDFGINRVFNQLIGQSVIYK